ncbi:MAG: hypothetical protein AB2A00_32985 [Myxococcota bacterium]
MTLLHVVATSALLLAGPKDGELQVDAVVNGSPQTTGCTVRVYPGGGQSSEKEEGDAPVVEGEAGKALTVPAGKYDVATVCNTERLTLASFSPGVTVKAGKTQKVPVNLESGGIILHAMLNGTRIKSEVAVLFPGTNYEVARGQGSNRIELATGTYDVRMTAEVEGDVATVLLEKQEVKAGRPTPQQVDMSPGKVELTVRRNGKVGEGAGAIALPGQARRIKEFSTGEPVSLAPGNYDVIGSLSSSFDFAEKRQRRVVVKPGVITKVDLDLPRGTIRTTCELDGKETVATVYGYMPGAEDYFNKAECGQTLELAPGKYHLKFELDAEKAGYKVLGGSKAPEIWVRNFVVDKSKEKPAKADFTPARLKVAAKKNGQPTDAAVTVVQTGTGTLGGGPSGEVLPIPPGRYDLEVLFPGKRAPSKETVRGVECRPHKECVVEVNLERATLVLEVFQAGKPASLAEVVLYKGGSEVPYVKGRSGEELEVPPGDYIPEVRLGDAKRQVNKMRLRPGDQETRKVELP